jgi:asparagine synthase (glutamine-hydrolysing)
MGFGTPLSAWLRGPLKNVLYQTLLDAQLMAPLSALVIKRTLQEFEAGINSHECRLWALLMFGYWRRQDVCDRAIINRSLYSIEATPLSGSKISSPC